MQIGILGVGEIGKTLALRLAAAGYEVFVANSGDPMTVSGTVLRTGAKAARTSEVVTFAEILILSIPLLKMPALRPLIDKISPRTVIIDTSNYIPHRDGYIRALDQGEVDSVWVQQQLGRPIVKAWNNILAETLAVGNLTAGDENRLAVAVAAETEQSFSTAAELVDATGFDAVYSGAIADSWRHQPGAPAYCTGMNKDEMASALLVAERSRLSERREASMLAVTDQMKNGRPFPSASDIIKINREIYLR